MWSDIQRAHVFTYIALSAKYRSRYIRMGIVRTLTKPFWEFVMNICVSFIVFSVSIFVWYFEYIFFCCGLFTQNSDDKYFFVCRYGQGEWLFMSLISFISSFEFIFIFNFLYFERDKWQKCLLHFFDLSFCCLLHWFMRTRTQEPRLKLGNKRILFIAFVQRIIERVRINAWLESHVDNLGVNVIVLSVLFSRPNSVCKKELSIVRKSVHFQLREHNFNQEHNLSECSSCCTQVPV